MAQNKTKATEVSVASFIALLPEPRRADAMALVKLMESVSGQKPKVWGTAIIGFGTYHYRYDSGREGDMPLLCFSPRKPANVIYNMGSADKSLLEKLGKHKLRGSCLHITKLSDVDAKLLKALLVRSFEKMRAEHGK
jgi:hypothetical protein